MIRWRLAGLTTFVITALVLIPRIGRTDPRLLIKQHAKSAAPPAVAALKAVPSLMKFQAVGRVTSTFVTGAGCTGSPFAACDTCDQIQISGPVVLTPGGEGTLTACLNITSGVTTCDDEQGNGTITLPNGDTITFATGGHFCIADEIPPASPTVILFVSTGGYTIEGGTGKESDAIGQGEFSVPFTQDGDSLTSTGELDMHGNYARQ